MRSTTQSAGNASGSYTVWKGSVTLVSAVPLNALEPMYLIDADALNVIDDRERASKNASVPMEMSESGKIASSMPAPAKAFASMLTSEVPKSTLASLEHDTNVFDRTRST